MNRVYRVLFVLLFAGVLSLSLPGCVEGPRYVQMPNTVVKVPIEETRRWCHGDRKLDDNNEVVCEPKAQEFAMQSGAQYSSLEYDPRPNFWIDVPSRWRPIPQVWGTCINCGLRFR